LAHEDLNEQADEEIRRLSRAGIPMVVGGFPESRTLPGKMRERSVEKMCTPKVRRTNSNFWGVFCICIDTF